MGIFLQKGNEHSKITTRAICTKDTWKSKKVEPKYPEKPKTTLKYSEYFKESIEEKLAKFSLPVKILLGIVSIPLLLTGIIFLILVILVVVSYKDYIIKKKELNNQLANSPEYLQAVENAEKTA